MSGSIHADYKLDPEKLPQKKNDYYEVYFLGTNSAVIEGNKMSLVLVPPMIKATDGTKWVLVNILSDNTKGYIRMSDIESNALLLSLFLGILNKGEKI